MIVFWLICPICDSLDSLPCTFIPPIPFSNQSTSKLMHTTIRSFLVHKWSTPMQQYLHLAAVTRHHPTRQLSLATRATLLVSFLWQLGRVFTGVLPRCNGHYATECPSQLWLTSRLGCWILLVEQWVVFRLLSHFHSLTDWLLIVSCSNTAMIWNGGISTKLASCLATLIGVFPGQKGDYATELASYLATLVKSHLVVKCLSSDGELYFDFYSFYCCTHFATLSISLRLGWLSLLSVNSMKTFWSNLLVV